MNTSNYTNRYGGLNVALKQRNQKKYYLRSENEFLFKEIKSLLYTRENLRDQKIRERHLPTNFLVARQSTRRGLKKAQLHLFHSTPYWTLVSKQKNL